MFYLLTGQTGDGLPLVVSVNKGRFINWGCDCRFKVDLHHRQEDRMAALRARAETILLTRAEIPILRGHNDSYYLLAAVRATRANLWIEVDVLKASRLMTGLSGWRYAILGHYGSEEEAEAKSSPVIDRFRAKLPPLDFWDTPHGLQWPPIAPTA